MKTPKSKSPLALGSRTPSTPNSVTSSLSKKKQKRFNAELSSGETVSPNERGVKRPHSPDLRQSADEDNSTSHLNDEAVPNAKRVRVQPKSKQGASLVLSPPKQSISFDAGEKALLLGAIRKRLAELDSRTLYVRKLPRNTTLAQLKALCPTSVTARIQANKHANRRKHAFIEFKSEDFARSALASIDGKLVADRPVKAELCSERQARPLSTETDQPGGKRTHWIGPDKRQLQEFCLSSLHVTCVPRVATQDEVRQLFPKARSFAFHMNLKQNSIGSCRVIFANEQDALEAFNSQHGTLLHDCPLIVNFAFKHGRGKKQIRDAALMDISSSAAPQSKSVLAQGLKPKKPKPKQLPVSQPTVKASKSKQQQQHKKSKPNTDVDSALTVSKQQTSSFNQVKQKTKVLASKKNSRPIEKKHKKKGHEKQ